MTIFGDKWGDLPMIFTSDEVMSENHWQITSQVNKKSLFTVTNVSFYFLYAILCSEHTISQKQLSIAHFAIVDKDGLFCISIVMSPHLICDITRTSIVTSYSSIVNTHADWRKGNLR